MCSDKNDKQTFQDNSLKIIEINENGQSFNIVDYFLSDTIEDKKDYYEFLRAVNSTSQYDEIHIHINCYGGDLDAAIQIYHSIVRSKARVFVYVEGACMSAATIVMMCADEIEFSPWSSIMIHSYSGCEFGKYHELLNSSIFHKEWFSNLMYDLYEDFLTKVEISQVLGGKDIWLTATEASERFKKMFRKRDREYSRLRRQDEKLMKMMGKMFDGAKLETGQDEPEQDEDGKEKKPGRKKGK